MPRDPIDISTHAAAKRARKIAELDDQKDPIRLRVGMGPAGATGPEGPKGEKGEKGATGPEGPKGEKGEKGATGSTGPEGKEGPQGKEGAAGSASMNGYKEPCRAATTANITISTALNNGDTLDGVTLATNDRVLVKNQTTKSENGLWIVGVTPARATDADTAGELRGGTIVYIEQGTINSDRVFRITTDGSITPGTTAHDWAEIAPATASGTIEVEWPGGSIESKTVEVEHGLGKTPKVVQLTPVFVVATRRMFPQRVSISTTKIGLNSACADAVPGAGVKQTIEWFASL